MEQNRAEIMEQVRTLLGEMSEAERVPLFNRYLESTQANGERIYTIDEFDEAMNDATPLEIAKMCVDEGFDYRDGFFMLDEAGVPHSSETPTRDSESNFDADEIVTYIVDEKDALGNERVKVALLPRANFYVENRESDRCYICFSEEQAKRLEHLAPMVMKDNVIIAKNEIEYKKLWHEPMFDGITINNVGIVYDDRNSAGELDKRVMTCETCERPDLFYRKFPLDIIEEKQGQGQVYQLFGEDEEENRLPVGYDGGGYAGE